MYLYILFTALQVRYLLVELLASQYPMNLDTMWNQLKRKWIFKQDDNDWKYIIHMLNKHNRCKKKNFFLILQTLLKFRGEKTAFDPDIL